MRIVLMKVVKNYLRTRPRLRRMAESMLWPVRSLFPSHFQRLSESYNYLFECVVGGSLKVQVPDLGVFEIGCRSHILGRVLITREFEPELVRALQKHTDPGRDAIDVGANVGLFTTYLASLLSEGRKVLAVEPTAGALGFLKRNLEAHNCEDKVIVFEGVAEANPGYYTLKVFGGMEEYSTLLRVAHPSVRTREYQELQVRGETIDNLVARYNLKPGIIKIDTEGAEMHVLNGCRQTILDHRPVILCESLPDKFVSDAGETPGALRLLLSDLGYIISNCEVDEILAIPKERNLAS